jgi:ABC-2 type transport system ATP-binding protein
MSDVIFLNSISKRLGKRQILKDVSFSVKPGDIFGYLGPNGAGKTTTIRIILGMMQATSGSALVLDKDVNIDKTRQKIGFVLEADGLYDNMTGFENLAFYAKIYGIPDPRQSIERALKLVDLRDRARDKVSAYSKGMRQRLALGRAILHNPDVLVLDEPTAGVDPSGQMEVRRIMLDMTGNEGKTIFLSSHNLDEVQRICNRIALIHKGEIRLYGEREALQKKMGKGEVEIETETYIPEQVLSDLKDQLGVAVQSQTDRTVVLILGKENVDVSDVISFLSRGKVKIQQVKKRQASLEEIYAIILKESEAK